MRRVSGLALTVATALVVAAPARAVEAPVTPTGWRISPAGSIFGVGPYEIGLQEPQGAALAPDGRHLLTASSGAARIESADLFDIVRRKRDSYVPYDSLHGQSVFYGVAFSRDGKTAWIAGGGQNVVHEYRVARGTLTEVRTLAVPSFAAGLAYARTPAGDRLYVVNNLSGPPGATNPPGHTVTILDSASGRLEKVVDLGAALEPLGVAVSPNAQKAYVTNWLGRSVSVIATATETKTKDIELSPPDDPLRADHPNSIVADPVRHRMYVANGNSDTVSIINTDTDTVAATVDVALVRGRQKGAIPDSLAVDPDGRRLYVALAGENAVAVIDLARPGARRRPYVAGYIPAEWYPSAVQVTPDGQRVVIVNANDAGAGPNRCGPNSPPDGCPPTEPRRDPPAMQRNTVEAQDTKSMIKGSVEVLATPSAARLKALTARVKRDNRVTEHRARRPRALRGIRHVIYVVKENRTYDQLFGDLPHGDGEASLNLFRDDTAPNHRALAKRFALIDNFYADAEVSADGHNWITQANAPDYVDKTWPINYSPGSRASQRAYDFTDVPSSAQFLTEPLATDPSVPRSATAQTVGYLWDDAYDHGLDSFRSYGEYTQPGDCTGTGTNISHTTRLAPRFGDHVDVQYPGYNLSCSDHAQREPEFEKDVHAHGLPVLSIVRLPNDHTRGTQAGRATPQAYVADNDLALGRLVQFVSHSRYWRSTVILVTEDDAQDGSDHVDAHRTVALAISPYTQHASVDSSQYDTASMLATIEELLGLPPMSIVDSRANRMWQAFSSTANMASYEAITPTGRPYDGTACTSARSCPYDLNPPRAPMARESARWDFSREDRAPEIQLNQAIWRSVNGRGARMPAPRHRLSGGDG